MTTRTLLPQAPCSLTAEHPAHRRTVRYEHGNLHLVARRLCPGIPTADLPVIPCAQAHNAWKADHPAHAWLCKDQFPAVDAQCPGGQHGVPAQPASGELEDVPLPRVRCGHCQGYHTSVAAVRECSTAHHATALEAPFRRATNEQERAEEERQAAAVPTRRGPAEEGMYRKDGVIYKVQRAVHGSGKPYAKELVRQSSETPNWKFEYAPGMVRELGPEHRLTLEQAKEFGALYGTCCVCGHVLTNEESIAAGIGPVCAGRL